MTKRQREQLERELAMWVQHLQALDHNPHGTGILEEDDYGVFHVVSREKTLAYIRQLKKRLGK